MLKELLKSLCLLFSIIAVMVFTGFALAGDILFFMSDTASAFIVVIAITIAVFIPLALALTGLTVFSPQVRDSAVQYLGRVFTVLMVVNFIYLLINMVDVKILLTLRAKYHIYPYAPWLYPEFFYPVAWMAIVLLAWRYFKKSKEVEAIARRGTSVAMALAPLALILFLALVANNKLSARTGGTEDLSKPGHVVLIVLDGWPAIHSRTLNMQTSGTFVEKELFFTNYHVNTPWTNGFFGTIYQGSPKSSLSYLSKLTRLLDEVSDSQDNLLSALQRNGVMTRTFHYHRNGMPEGSAGRTYNYKGFRSLFLTPRFSPLLHALGLRYNMAYKGPTKPVRANNGNDARSYFISKLLFPARKTEDYDNILTDLLLPELARVRNDAQRSFVIFHVEWGLGYHYTSIESDKNLSEEEIIAIKKTRAKVESHDYHYAEEDIWFVEKIHRRTKAFIATKSVEDQIAMFLDELDRRDLLENTVIILTADHGNIAERNRLFYGYHSDEEVTRVPLFVFGAGRPAIDNRNFETIDITQTVLEYFGISKRFHGRAQSMLSDGIKPFTTSVTQPSDINREWFLVLYRGDRKFVFNIHPEGDGKSLEQKVDGFETTTVAEGPDVIRTILPELMEALDDFRIYEISDKTVHANYSKARLKELQETARLR
jgi:hypothetical protein